MASVEDKINNFIDLVFLEAQEIQSISETDIEDVVFTAVLRFKEKMLTCQLGIITVVEEYFFKYFSSTALNTRLVSSMAMDLCISAYYNFPNIFLALMFNCSFLVTVADCCARNGLLEFKETIPSLCKKVLAFMTNSYCLEKQWENLLQFSMAHNLPEIIEIVKSCLTDDHSLFRICDVSALKKFRDFCMNQHRFLSILITYDDENPFHESPVIKSLNDLEECVKLKISESEKCESKSAEH